MLHIGQMFIWQDSGSRSLSLGPDLSPGAKHFALTVPLSTQALVQSMDNAIYQIMQYLVDSIVCFVKMYSLFSACSSG